ncbi:SFT2-like vesicle transport protein [Chloropicon roscoffensis]|uniref:Vesicle transport protein n=2 Tax=Chloropicon roscoffensis TaxID=1461544 RepID=A0AAX4P715_9CHLO
MDFSNPFSSSKGLSGSKMLDSLKESVGLKEKEQSLLGDLEDSISLTKMQRLYGFGICLGIGILLSLLSTMFLFPVPRVKKFATCYTLGNLLSIGCTCFLMGPWKQIKNMFKGHRLAATVVYLCSIGFTLYAALKLNNLALTLIFLLVQICALVWYCMTYVPFGQRMLKSCVGRCIGDFGDDW